MIINIELSGNISADTLEKLHYYDKIPDYEINVTGNINVSSLIAGIFDNTNRPYQNLNISYPDRCKTYIPLPFWDRKLRNLLIKAFSSDNIGITVLEAAVKTSYPCSFRYCTGDSNGKLELDWTNYFTSMSTFPSFANNLNIKEVDLTGIEYKNMSSAFANCYNLKKVTLPSNYTTIPNDMFNGDRSLEQINIPNNINSIGSNAFGGCTRQKRVDIADLGSWLNIDFSNANSNPLLNNGNLYLNNELLINIEIPENITEIKKYAFYGYKPLLSMILHENITSIKESALQNTSISELLFPNNSRITEAYLYDPLTTLALKNANITQANLHIPDATYPKLVKLYISGCNNLEPGEIIGKIYASTPKILYLTLCWDGEKNITTVLQYNALLSISNSTIKSLNYDNNVLTESNSKVNISGTLKLDNVPAYEDDINDLQNALGESFHLVYDPDNAYIRFDSDEVLRVLLANNVGDGTGITKGMAAEVTTLPNFQGNTEITRFDELKYFTEVTTIGSNCFNGCTALQTVFFPSNVISFQSNAFQNTNLSEVHITNLANWIASTFSNQQANPLNGGHACLYLDGELVTDLRIPEGTTEIKNYAFYKCKNEMQVTLPEGLQTIGYFSFGGCSNVTFNGLPGSVTTIESNAFEYTKWNGPITIPAAVSLKNNISAFHGATGITSLTIESSGSINAYYAFASSSITTLNITGGVTSIGSFAFNNCKSLTTVTLPNTIETLNGFLNCTALTTINIPSSVTSIGKNAFDGCSQLKVLIMYPTIPPELGANALNGTHADLCIYVLDESLQAYKTATGWSGYATKIHPMSDLYPSPSGEEIVDPQQCGITIGETTFIPYNLVEAPVIDGINPEIYNIEALVINSTPGISVTSDNAGLTVNTSSAFANLIARVRISLVVRNIEIWHRDISITDGLAILAPISEAFPEGINPIIYNHIVSYSSKYVDLPTIATTRGYITANDLKLVTRLGDNVIYTASFPSKVTFHEFKYFTSLPSTFGGWGLNFENTANIIETTLPPQISIINKLGNGATGLEVIVLPVGVTEIKYDCFSDLIYIHEVWFYSETPPTCTITTSSNKPGISSTKPKRIYVPAGAKTAYKLVISKWGFDDSWTVVEMS